MDNTITETINTTKETSPVASFLITIGQALLLEKQHNWMDMNDLEDFCGSHGILLDGKTPTSEELEMALTGFFQSSAEFYAPGLVIDAYYRRIGWERVFMLRAYPHHPAQQSSCVNITDSDTGDITTACHD